MSCDELFPIHCVDLHVEEIRGKETAVISRTVGLNFSSPDVKDVNNVRMHRFLRQYITRTNML